MDALARHDQDIIFSIDDDEEEEEMEETTTSSHLHTQQIIRAGAPLNLYRENRRKDDDESENEMEREL
jgi:hypothetical protein